MFEDLLAAGMLSVLGFFGLWAGMALVVLSATGVLKRLSALVAASVSIVWLAAASEGVLLTVILTGEGTATVPHWLVTGHRVVLMACVGVVALSWLPHTHNHDQDPV